MQSCKTVKVQWGDANVYVTLKTPDLYISILTVSGYIWSACLNDNICWCKKSGWKEASLTLVNSFERICEERGEPPILHSMRR